MQNEQGCRETECVSNAGLFQDRLMEEPPSTNAPAADRHRYAALRRQATEICGRCPFRQDCLYSAVAEHDVVGFVGGTTQRQREAIRQQLGIVVEPEDFDTLAGVTAPNRQVDHDEVVRLRKSNPQDTLEDIARRLGCSLSTVKRHLRRARAEQRSDDVLPIKPRTRVSPPQVLAVAAVVLGAVEPYRRAA